jgi:hypothetical protein
MRSIVIPGEAMDLLVAPDAIHRHPQEGEESVGRRVLWDFDSETRYSTKGI